MIASLPECRKSASSIGYVCVAKMSHDLNTYILTFKDTIYIYSNELISIGLKIVTTVRTRTQSLQPYRLAM